MERCVLPVFSKKLPFRLLWGLILASCLAVTASASEVAVMSVGQSPDAMMVRVLLKRMKVDSDYNAMLQKTELDGQKVLIAVVGGSSKGLGAAGIDKEQEMARAREVFGEAKAKGIRILIMHVGGEGRRGELSDFFVNDAVPFGEKIIVVRGGNDDGIFDKLKAPDAPVSTVEKIQGTQEPLAEILKEWGVHY
jgi:hypothetical protein